MREDAEKTLTDTEKRLKERAARLKSFLEPLHEERDQAKMKYEADHGQGRWTSIPNPKNDYAAKRRDAERELKLLREALSELEALRKMDLFSL